MKKRQTLARVAAAVVVIAMRAVVPGKKSRQPLTEFCKVHKNLAWADRMQYGMRKKKFC
jgi:hypothetical protein